MLPRRRGQVGRSIAIFLLSLRSRKVDFPVESTLWSGIWAGGRPRAGPRTRFLYSATLIYVKAVLLVFIVPGEPQALERPSYRCQCYAVGGADVRARSSKVQICRCQPQSRQQWPPHSMRICPRGESLYLRRLGSTGAQKLLESFPLARFWIWLR